MKNKIPILWRWWMSYIDTNEDEKESYKNKNSNNIRNNRRVKEKDSSNNSSNSNLNSAREKENNRKSENTEDDNGRAGKTDKDLQDRENSGSYNRDNKEEVLGIIGEEESDKPSVITNDESTQFNGGVYSNETHIFNNVEVINISRRLEKNLPKRFATEFYKVIEMIAEEETNIISFRDYNKYNVKKLLLRRYEGKPPSKYRVSRKREKIVIIVDTSGSMVRWEELILAVTQLARKRGDVEIYSAPNGAITSKWDERSKKWLPVMNPTLRLRNRKIIYIGDFDGADTPIELSQPNLSNTVIYICTEDRYKYFDSHDWVHYDEKDYKGYFIRAWTEEEILKGLKKIVSFPTSRWIDFHEDDCFRDTCLPDDYDDGYNEDEDDSDDYDYDYDDYDYDYDDYDYDYDDYDDDDYDSY